jgi:hypothetical protein
MSTVIATYYQGVNTRIKKKKFKVSRSVTSEEGRFFKNFNKNIIIRKLFFILKLLLKKVPTSRGGKTRK